MNDPNARGRVLAIDDDHLVGAMLAAHAKAAGFDAKVTDSPEEFYALATAWKPTFVVVDLVMGAVDGLAVLKRLAELKSDAAVIITSGMGSKILDSARQFAAASGLAYGGVLHKPFRRADVAAVLAAGAHAPERLDPALDVLESWDAATFERELRAAAANDHLRVVFQPKVSCAQGTVTGFEALVRWYHPTVGLIPPVSFIPRAESMHLVSIVTDAVIARALSWFGRSRAHTAERLAINISASELSGPGLGKRLLAACSQAGIAPERIVLEVTETSAVADVADSLEVLTRLRLDGFQLSIDDFGTGYSSMIQLSNLPFSEVKIDRSFVRNLGQSLPADVMVRSMLQLSRGLGLESTAEGVETAAALAVLSEMDCDFAQGYHIGYPMDEHELEQWLATQEQKP
ncbi:EAL domain-containing response regulator [Demequina sp. TTPB684]|uniref:EAL domain-containing response regulator n=1 Tax=unclassified Demequina TaxID=2620311 RepID=UPI001CF24D53|nr:MULTISPECIES: EAL domain-containing response regulator [unclassified Demequina]MCB2412509.1 EAL domain-containing response regulator [Demequina sp. TTPB684]UPU88788.1 EAL domain-containing response regulator [Demequina sp. TMPB413]